jgi:hypothetical protein
MIVHCEWRRTKLSCIVNYLEGLRNIMGNSAMRRTWLATHSHTYLPTGLSVCLISFSKQYIYINVYQYQLKYEIFETCNIFIYIINYILLLMLLEKMQMPIYLSICLSTNPSICPSIHHCPSGHHLYINPPTHQPAYPSTRLWACSPISIIYLASIFLSVYKISVFLPVYFFTYSSLHSPIHPHTHSLIHPSIHPSTYASTIYMSMRFRKGSTSEGFLETRECRKPPVQQRPGNLH